MKTTRILKAILVGALIGAAIFFIPFPFRFFFGFFIIFFIARSFFGWGWRGRGHYNNRFGMFRKHEYAERWRNMSDEERKTFISKMEKELFAQSGSTTTQNPFN